MTKCKECGMPESGLNYGEGNPFWKGGKYLSRGYVLKWEDRGGGRHQNHALEHRTVMERFIGRPLESGEIVHHINSNRTDNRIENLVLMNRSGHNRLHGYDPVNINQCKHIAVKSGWLKRKLTFAQAQEIRKVYGEGGKTQKQLGVEYGVSRDVIQTIVTNKTYLTKEGLYGKVC